jgi:superfamily II DNA helicase RecQ
MDQSLQAVLQSCLQSRFGYAGFRRQQLEVMLNVLHGRDSFCLMATGEGKSLLYQLPAVALREKGVKVTTLVISPLIALMEDQIEHLASIGVSALALGGTSSHDEEEAAMDGQYALVYLTPEKAAIWHHGFERLMTTTRIVCLAVDESHCVSEWGHDFRPQYRQLGALRKILHGVPCLALSATATVPVQKDIISSLQLRRPFAVSSCFNRRNLKYHVFERSGATDLLRALLLVQSQGLDASNNGKELPEAEEEEEAAAEEEDDDEEEEGEWVQAHNHPSPRARPRPAAKPNKSAAAPTVTFQPTLVYVMTKKECESLAEAIRQSRCFRAVKVATYHAGLSLQERKATQAAFARDEVQVVVATAAFGMGVHKDGIRAVVHFGMPQSLETYYQQSGRAGRDGAPASCVLLYHRSDDARCWNIGQNYSEAAAAAGEGGAGECADGAALRAAELTTTSILEELSKRLCAEVAREKKPSGATAAGGGGAKAEAGAGAGAAQRVEARMSVVREFIRGVGGCRRRFLLAFFGQGAASLEELRAQGQGRGPGQAPERDCCDLCDEAFSVLEKAAVAAEAMQGQEGGCGLPMHTHLPPAAVLVSRVDLGPEVLLLLRAIQETSTGEAWGVGLPLQVLLGSHDKLTQRLPGYSSLSTFGCGQARGKDWWMALCRQLAETEGLVSLKFVRGAGGKFSYQHASLTAPGAEYLRRYSAWRVPAGGGGGGGGKATPAHFLVPCPELAALMRNAGSGGEGASAAAAAGGLRRVPGVPAANFTTAAARSEAAAEARAALQGQAARARAARAARLEAARAAVEQRLLHLRDTVARSTGAKPYTVLSSFDMQQICAPRALRQCCSMQGLEQLGVLEPWKLAEFGAELAALVASACKEACVSEEHEEDEEEGGDTMVEDGSPFRPLPLPPPPQTEQLVSVRGRGAAPQLYRPAYIAQQRAPETMHVAVATAGADGSCVQQQVGCKRDAAEMGGGDHGVAGGDENRAPSSAGNGPGLSHVIVIPHFCCRVLS